MVALLRFELIDLVTRARPALVVGLPIRTILDQAAIPATIEDRAVPGGRQCVPEGRQPMTFVVPSLAPGDAAGREMSRIP